MQKSSQRDQVQTSFYFLRKTLYQIKARGQYIDFNMLRSCSTWVYNKKRNCVKFQTVNAEANFFLFVLQPKRKARAITRISVTGNNEIRLLTSISTIKGTTYHIIIIFSAAKSPRNSTVQKERAYKGILKVIHYQNVQNLLLMQVQY